MILEQLRKNRQEKREKAQDKAFASFGRSVAFVLIVLAIVVIANLTINF